MAMAREAGARSSARDGDFDPDGPMDDGNPMGMTEDELTLVVDVSDFVRSKHAVDLVPRQSGDRCRLLHRGCRTRRSPYAFGREWFIEHGREPGLRPGWLFEERVIPVR